MTGLEILAGFFSYILGKSTGWSVDWAKDAAFGSIKKPARELNKQFRAATQQWERSLPEALRGKGFDPQQFWSVEIAVDPTHVAERELAARLWSRDVPSVDQFRRVLVHRYHRLRLEASGPNRHPSGFYSADTVEVQPYLEDFAKRLHDVCVCFPPLGVPGAEKQRQRIEDKLEQLVEDRVQESIGAETDIFLSYRFRLREEVEPLIDALEHAGVRVWRDVDKIRLGDTITNKLRKALARTRTLAVLATEDYFDSEICAWELASAWSVAEGIAQADKRILLLKPADIRSLEAIRVGPLKDSLAFDIPVSTSNLRNLAQNVAEHLKQVDRRPLGATATFVTPAFYPQRQSGSNRFVGRMSDLWRLHGMLQRSRVVGVTGKTDGVAQVRGLGGIGKTLLAIEYSRRFDIAWPGGIFWIDAVAKNSTGRRAFLANLAEMVGVTPAADLNTTATLVEKKIAELTENKPYLWVLDNVPDRTTKNAIDVRMPPSSNGVVLLTTRWCALEYLGEKLDLGVLDPISSYKLLTQDHSPVDDDEIAAAQEITKLVGCHPLALDVLRALVRRKARFTGSPYRNWADGLRLSSIERFDEAAESLREELPTNVARAISAVLASSLDSCSQRALDVLLVASVLAPDPIPGVLFTSVLSRCDGAHPTEVEAAVDELESLALTRPGFDVHALVRKIVRDTRSTPTRIEELAEAARTELASRLGKVSDVREHMYVESYISHAMHCSEANSANAMKVRALLGLYFHARSDYANARLCDEDVLKVREQVLGADHPDTLTALQNLAITLDNQGDHTGARQRLEQILTVHERLFGSEHPKTLGTQVNLALTLYSQGYIGDARLLLERILPVFERILGPDHPDTLSTLHNLGLTLYTLKDLRGARKCYEKVLHKRNRTLGPDHADTLRTLINLAATLKAQGDLPGARYYLERVLRARESILGPEHWDTLRTLQLLGDILFCLGDLKMAHQHVERAFVASEGILGLEHPDTLCALRLLAAILKRQGELGGARECLERAAVALKDSLGSEHPETLSTRMNLARLAFAQGEVQKARTVGQEVLRTRERIFGNRHAATQESRDFLLTLRMLSVLDPPTA